MNYNRFGTTDLHVSEIGFGAWAIGGNAMIGDTAIGWGQADDSTSRIAIRAALDAGINFFDTADIYGLGHSEELLGNELQHQRNVIIATKVGNVSRDNKFTVDYSKQHVFGACEQSLRRLKRETIDYYQLHTARLQHLQNGECIEAMQTLQQQGKIRYWGLSLNTFYPDAEAEFILKEGYGHGFQLVFNIINQRALGVVKKAFEANYGVIARMPLQFGLLTGKFNEKSTFEKDDHRHNRLTQEVLRKSFEILEEKVWPLADKEKLTPAQLALSFIISLQGISTVIPGIRTEEHVVQNTSGVKRLSPETMQALFSLSDGEMQPLMQLIEQIG